MARLYEMCNEIDSEDILLDREELTEEEKAKLFSAMKEEGVIQKRQQRSSGNKEKNTSQKAKNLKKYGKLEKIYANSRFINKIL